MLGYLTNERLTVCKGKEEAYISRFKNPCLTRAQTVIEHKLTNVNVNVNCYWKQSHIIH